MNVPQKLPKDRELSHNDLDEKEELGLELGIEDDEGLSATDEGGEQDEDNLEGESRGSDGR